MTVQPATEPCEAPQPVQPRPTPAETRDDCVWGLSSPDKDPILGQLRGAETAVCAECSDVLPPSPILDWVILYNLVESMRFAKGGYRSSPRDHGVEERRRSTHASKIKILLIFHDHIASKKKKVMDKKEGKKKTQKKRIREL